MDNHDILIVEKNIRSSLQRAYEKAGTCFDWRYIQLKGPSHTYPMYEHDKLVLRGMKLEKLLDAYNQDPERNAAEIKKTRAALRRQWSELKALVIP